MQTIKRSSHDGGIKNVIRDKEILIHFCSNYDMGILSKAPKTIKFKYLFTNMFYEHG